MTEDVLQYIWQTQSFDKNRLLTTTGEEIKLFDPGTLNTGSGPDFSQANLELAGINWSGDIEIHTYASHWDRHRHGNDTNYDKVILHVVWEADQVVTRSDGSIIPALELKERLSADWLARYRHLMQSLNLIPCETYLRSIDKLLIKDRIQSALVERLESKSDQVLSVLKTYRGDWQKTALNCLFVGFGFKKNKPAFEQLADVTDPSIIDKLTSWSQIEAYLFGQAGLLPDHVESQYVNHIKEEYKWLNKKYGVQKMAMAVTSWKFMRLRPANFPTLRIAQLATFLNSHKRFFRVILETEVGELRNLFQFEQRDYWQHHYHFTRSTNRRLTGLGLESQENLMINVVCVLLVAYGKYMDQVFYIEKAVKLLNQLKPESNRIISYWRSFDITPESAAESQGLLELFNTYCKKSRCLSCNIGQHIIKMS